MRCWSDQTVRGLGIEITGGHVLARKCVGDPCELVVHATAAFVCRCAAEGLSTRSADLQMTRVPCLSCARLLIAARPAAIRFDSSEVVDEKSFQLLATRIALHFDSAVSG